MSHSIGSGSNDAEGSGRGAVITGSDMSAADDAGTSDAA